MDSGGRCGDSDRVSVCGRQILLVTASVCVRDAIRSDLNYSFEAKEEVDSGASGDGTDY